MREIKKFINGFQKYNKAMKLLAHKAECQFRITVYQTPDKYIALLDNNKNYTAVSYSINDVIKQIKGLYPEVKNEEGIKYYPLSEYYKADDETKDYYLDEEE